jgi:glutamine amidotransferase
MTDVAVIDYGVGNLLSVSRAFAHCGADVVVTSDPAAIRAARRVVVPGVGAFIAGMHALREHQLDAVVREVAARGTPLLGICLGMQMLMETSEEFGETEGLGLIPGRVVGIPAIDNAAQPLKVPHIGWSELVLPDGRASWQGSVLEAVMPGDAAYFVHSYMACPSAANHRLADCLVGGHRVCAAVKRDNVQGCQFHPEKSGNVGLAIIRTFLSHA